MNNNRHIKEQVIQELGNDFAKSEAVFVINCQGMSVPQIQTLRFALHDKQGALKVAKNRYAKIALEQNKSNHNVVSSALVGQNAIVFSKSDLTGVAKVLFDFAKANEELKLVAGSYASKFLDAKEITKLASIPSREVLLAQLFGTMKAPITALAVVLKQIAEKKSSAGSSVESV